jgi:hypothetical protein
MAAAACASLTALKNPRSRANTSYAAGRGRVTSRLALPARLGDGALQLQSRTCCAFCLTSALSAEAFISCV